MTQEEAIECLKRRLKCAEYVDSDYCDSIDLEAIKNAIDALEKQISMLWEESFEGYETIYTCPKCKEDFVTMEGTPADNLWNYCPSCGQKLDWR